MPNFIETESEIEIKRIFMVWEIKKSKYPIIITKHTLLQFYYSWNVENSIYLYSLLL